MTRVQARLLNACAAAGSCLAATTDCVISSFGDTRYAKHVVFWTFGVWVFQTPFMADR